MSAEHILIALGLTPNEVKIYLTMLDLGMAPISLISRRASLKRPTTYGVVKKLRKRGLTDCFLRKGVRYYSVISPVALHGKYAEYLRAFETALPTLTAKHEKIMFKPRVHFYEGKKELEKLYEEILNDADEIFAYVVPETAQEYFSKEWLLAFFKKLGEKKGKRKIISVDTALSRSIVENFSSKSLEF